MEDLELIDDYLSGDETAITVLISRYLRDVYNFVFQMTRDAALSDDVTQDTFVKAWKNLRKYNSDFNFRSWLFRIARNTAIDYLRKRRHIKFSEFDDEDGNNYILDTVSDDEPLPEELVARFEEEQELNRILDRLKLNDRELIFLHLNQGLSFEEIGQISGESVNTIKSRYRRTIIKLRKEMSN